MHPEEQLSISRQTGSDISIAGISRIGAAIEKLTLAGREIISKENLGSTESMFFGSLLAPWPNRLAGAKYRYREKDFQAPHVDRDGNANHGLVFDREAKLIEISESYLRLGYQFGDDPSYPFELDLTIDYTIYESTLEVRAVASNRGPDAPFGLGFHPYFLLGEKFTVEADFNTQLEVNRKMIPIGEKAISGLSYRGGQIDDCFRGADRVRVMTSSHAFEVSLDVGYEYFMLYRPDESCGESLLAIEPMSCPANAFNSGIEELIIKSGERKEFGFSIRTL